jgi:hypothetical protein
VEELRIQVISTQRRFNDLLDDPSAGAAQILKREIQALEDDLQVKKNPRTIEDRVKHIIHLLEGEAKAERIMNYEHLEMFCHQFEHFRGHLQKLM